MRTLISATSLCMMLASAAASASAGQSASASASATANASASESASASASTSAADPGQVVITGMKNPDMRSYRGAVAGLDAFDEYHRFAPLAPDVQFRLVRRTKSAAPAEPLALRIVGDGEADAIPLAIDADGMFTVPRIQAAYDSKADLVLNQKKGKFRALPEVRTPGLPDNVRRLGDLRLECRVQIAVAKYDAPFWVIALVNTILLTGDWCGHEKLDWLVTTTVALTGATLVHGDRRLALKVRDRQFTVPLIGDKSWPDDALVELSVAEPEGAKKSDAMTRDGG
jgi:hypothetical protein